MIEILCMMGPSGVVIDAVAIARVEDNSAGKMGGDATTTAGEDDSVVEVDGEDSNDKGEADRVSICRAALESFPLLWVFWSYLMIVSPIYST